MQTQVAEAGVEPPSNSTGNPPLENENGAECGAVGAQIDGFDPDLVAVVEAWPGLPEAIKTGILAMVRTV